MIRKAVLVLLPVATLVSPMLFFRAPEWWSQMTASFSSAAPAGAAQQAVADSSTPPANNKALTAGDLASAEAAPVYELSEVLRFDVTPGWIVARWPRVSAGLAQLQRSEERRVGKACRSRLSPYH